jgi:protein-tyrosine phosphatase
LLFDDNDQVAAEILKFIDEALQEQFGVLVHSTRGQSRSACVLIIYFMMKFNWSLMKSLEFVTSRRPNLEIRASFLQQVQTWQLRRMKRGFARGTETWDEIPIHIVLKGQ